MKLTDLTDSAESRNAILQETKSSPSLKQSFFYYQQRDSFTVVSQDERAKKRLSNVWDAVRDFLYVSYIFPLCPEMRLGVRNECGNKFFPFTLM